MSLFRKESKAVARELGLCIECLKAWAVTSYCGRCMEHRAEMQANRKKRWIESGLCSRCGHEKDNDKRKMCGKCREYMRTTSKARKGIVHV